MGDRALAHIEKVVQVYGIEKADRVEMVQILDYHVVSKKGEFNVGDLVVYVEVDSILPDGLDLQLVAKYDELKKRAKKAAGDELAAVLAEMEEITLKNTRPEFEFLRAKKFRIRGVKFGSLGVVSMGIVFQLSILPADIQPVEGLDVTTSLGVTKFIEDPDEVNEEPTSMVTKKSAFEKMLDRKFMRYSLYKKLKESIVGSPRSGKWDEWMAPKTDEENIQKIFTRLKSIYGDQEVWAVTSKIEGQSMSAYHKEEFKWFGLSSRHDFAVCSRGRHLITDDGSRFWQTAKELDLERKLKLTRKNIMISGEHAGPGIQGNIYKRPKHELYVFRVWDIDAQRRYSHDEMLEFCFKYELNHVPVVSHKMALLETVQDMLTFSNGTDELVPGVKVAREGVVWQNLIDPKLSFKTRSPEYIILHGK